MSSSMPDLISPPPRSRSPSPAPRSPSPAPRSPSPAPPPSSRTRRRRVSSRSRSRSSSSSSSSSSDGIDRSLRGKDGLHFGQRATAARLRNPGKYTDKSMRQAHSKRSRARERTPSQPSVMSENQRIRGICVNTYGSIKPCRELVTRVNFRPTHVNGRHLPIQIVYAMLLDEQPEIVRTYDASLVTQYFAGVVARALADEREPQDWRNLLRFAHHTVNILSQVYTMTGDVDPITVLAERYLQPTVNQPLARRWIRNSIVEVRNATVLGVLKDLKKLVDSVNPDVRLWSYDATSPKEYDTVLLRRGQIKTHPWEQLKEVLEQSVREFQRGQDAIRMRMPNNDGDDPDEGDNHDGDGNNGRGGGRGRGTRRGRPRRGGTRNRGRGRGGGARIWSPQTWVGPPPPTPGRDVSAEPGPSTRRPRSRQTESRPSAAGPSTRRPRSRQTESRPSEAGPSDDRGSRSRSGRSVSDRRGPTTKRKSPKRSSDEDETNDSGSEEEPIGGVPAWYGRADNFAT